MCDPGFVPVVVKKARRFFSSSAAASRAAPKRRADQRVVYLPFFNRVSCLPACRKRDWPPCADTKHFLKFFWKSLSGGLTMRVLDSASTYRRIADDQPAVARAGGVAPRANRRSSLAILLIRTDSNADPVLPPRGRPPRGISRTRGQRQNASVDP